MTISIEEDVCKDLVEERCNTPGCKIIYDFNGDFLGCTECSSDLRECKDYGDQEDCGLDECHFKNCQWVESGEGGCLSLN